MTAPSPSGRAAKLVAAMWLVVALAVSVAILLLGALAGLAALGLAVWLTRRPESRRAAWVSFGLGALLSVAFLVLTAGLLVDAIIELYPFCLAILAFCLAITGLSWTLIRPAQTASLRRARRWRFAALAMIAVVAAVVPTIWLWPWPTTAESWHVAGDGALVFSVRGDHPVRFDSEWPWPRDSRTIHFRAARPWFGGSIELRYYDEGVPRPSVVIDGATGQPIPRR
jgi:hypothetical protein